MKSKNQKLEKIARVMALKRRRADLELSKLIANERALRDGLADIQDAQKQMFEPNQEGGIMSAVMRQSWQAWADRQRMQLNQALASVLAEKEVAVAKAKHAIATENVAKRLKSGGQSRR